MLSHLHYMCVQPIKEHKGPFNSLMCASNAQPDEEVRLLINLPDYIIKAK